MTEKEKAKAYDKAIERAIKHRNHDGLTLEQNETIDIIFPELKEKESENERIRKEIIELLRNWASLHYISKEQFSERMAWLEKQGEQKPTLPKWKYKKDNTPLLRDSIILNKYGGVAKSPSGAIVSDVWVLDYDELAKLPKEEKIEPKFKVGDWVIFITSGSIYQVEKIENYEYTLRHILGGSLCLSFSDENLIREWTIQDAKDGDVLACNEEILLFKSYSELQGRISLYCWYNGHTNNFHSKEVIDILMTTTNKIYPATKEQRDTLMKAMNDAGYEWDVEKKELRKNVRVQ